MTIVTTWEGLAQLHTDKGKVYGDSWCRRGERLSILPNILRKTDRLDLYFSSSPEDREASNGTEDILDSSADLVVYLAKYLDWLSNHRGYGAEHDAAVAGILRELSDSAPDASAGVPHLVKGVDRYADEVDSGYLSEDSEKIPRIRTFALEAWALMRELSP